MNPNADHVKHFSPAQWQSLKQGVRLFQQDWTEKLMAETLGQMPADHPLRYASLVEMTRLDLARRWKQGQRVTLEDYLKSYPELGSVHTVGVDLIRSEYDARKAAGDRVELGEYSRRFPNQFEAFQQSLTAGEGHLASPVAAAFGPPTQLPIPGHTSPAPADTAAPPVPEPGARWPWVVGASLLLVAGVLGGMVYVGGFRDPQTKSVPVPNVVGQTPADASTAVTAVGLTMTTGGDPKLGNAMAQKPAAGALANPGDAITVLFPVEVPSVVGQTPADASTALTAAGLAMTSSGDPKSGKAIGQNPLAGGLAVPGDVITVLFPAPVPLTVPHVVGQTPADASTALTAVGLTMKPAAIPRSAMPWPRSRRRAPWPILGTPLWCSSPSRCQMSWVSHQRVRRRR
jgi:hypothetical protein